MRQLLALEQHNILPARFGEMVENRTTDNAATNDDNTGMGFHGISSKILKSEGKNI
jgi:hypothetical protein